MKRKQKSRREFLKFSLRTSSALAIGVSGLGCTMEREKRDKPRPLSGSLNLGVASYSLRAFSRSEAIDMIKQLRTSYVSVKSFHLPYESSDQEIEAAVHEFEKAGLKVRSGGVIYLQKSDDADIRRHFEYARKSRMAMMIIAPTAETLPLIEKYVKAYDIKVAIHNHGPEDAHFPAPSDAIKLINNMDPRVGVCIDVGHTTRTGKDLLQEIRNAGSRLLDLHIKDLRNLSDKNSQTIVGEGVMPVVGIFRQLLNMQYAGCVNLEFEIDEKDPLPGMQRSFAYMRGVLTGLTVFS